MKAQLVELWHYRELYWTLVYRDFKVLRRNTVLGIFWVLVKPLATSLALIIAIRGLGAQPVHKTVEAHYPIFVLLNVILWQFFSRVVTQTSLSLVVNQDLIKKIYFPRSLLPLVPVPAVLGDLSLGLALCVVSTYVFQLPINAHVFVIVLGTIFLLIFALAIGTILSIFNCVVRDVSYALPYALQIFFLFTPIVYSVNTIIPENYRSYIYLNPLAVIFSSIQDSLFSTKTTPAGARTVAVIVILSIFFLAVLTYRKLEARVIDRL